MVRQTAPARLSVMGARFARNTGAEVRLGGPFWNPRGRFPGSMTGTRQANGAERRGSAVEVEDHA
mgnify:CR=1 FL=1